MAITNEGTTALNQDEHNEDAHAKRVILRYQNPTDGLWYNFTPPMTAGVDYDYESYTATSATQDTIVRKLGGSGGTIVQTEVINYKAGAEKISDTFVYRTIS